MTSLEFTCLNVVRQSVTIGSTYLRARCLAFCCPLDLILGDPKMPLGSLAVGDHGRDLEVAAGICRPRTGYDPPSLRSSGSSLECSLGSSA